MIRFSRAGSDSKSIQQIDTSTMSDPSADEGGKERDDAEEHKNMVTSGGGEEPPFFASAMDDDDEVEEYSYEQEQKKLDSDPTVQRALQYVETVTTWVAVAAENNEVAEKGSGVTNILQDMKGLYHGKKTSKLSKDRGHFDTMHQMIDALRGLGVCLREIYEKEVGNELFSIFKSQYVVDHVARIPHFIPTILLLENEVLKREILSLPIVTRALMSKFSVLTEDTASDDEVDQSNTNLLTGSHMMMGSNLAPGSWFSNTTPKGARCWLLDILKHSETKHLGVEYLEMISNLKVTDYLRLPTSANGNDYQVKHITPTKETVNAFNQERMALFQTIAKEDTLILRLFTLSNRDMERAGITATVQMALNRGLQRPFMMTLLFSDFLFHLVLLILYRNVMFRTHRNKNFENDFLSSIVLGCIVYFWFRSGLELALAKVSWRVFWKSVTYVWTLLELVSTVMVTTSWVFLEGFGSNRNPQPSYFAFQAFVIGIMWLKVMGFLQIMNSTLAAYINSLFEILVAMIWFCLMMLVVIMAFGDMFYTIYTAFRRVDENGESACDLNESVFCEDDRAQSYLTIYRMFVGDFGYDDFDIDALTTFLYVAVTFVGVVVLLNMLIAIVTTSYEESRERSDRQFARARIALVAKSVALEQLLMPRKDASCTNRWLSILVRVATSCVLLYLSFLGGSVFYAISFGIMKAFTVPSDIADTVSYVITFMVTIYLFFILAVYLWFGWEGQPETCIYRFVLRRRLFNWCVYKPVRFVTLIILGAQPWKKNQGIQDEFDDDGWADYAEYTNKGTLAMFDSANTDQNESSSSSSDLERRLLELETDRQAERAAMEKQAADREAKHQAEIESIKKRAAEQETKYLAALEERDARHMATLAERDATNEAMRVERDEKNAANLRDMEKRLLEALQRASTSK